MARILYVDDDYSFRENVKALCRSLGWKLQPATTAAEAIREEDRENFDLIICDGNLGREIDDGIRLAIHFHVKGKQVIVYSGSEASLAKAKAAGLSTVDKYLGEEALLTAIESILSK